jgi:hypothetical protein
LSFEKCQSAAPPAIRLALAPGEQVATLVIGQLSVDQQIE